MREAAVPSRGLDTFGQPDGGHPLLTDDGQALAQLLRATQPNKGPAAPFPGEDEWTRRILGEDPRPLDRAWIALMLATTPEIWQALLQGEPVNPRALEQTWLRRLRTLGIV